jgi:B12-binding domain/radical SAM domain protein
VALPQLVVHHARNGVHAFNVLTAALRADPRTAALEIVFAKDAAAIARAVRPSALVAWSFYSPEAHEIESALRDVRAHTGDGVHIAGGVHATAEPLDTLRRGFDLVALGEGEKTIVDLVLALADGRDPLSVRGIGRLRDDALESSGRGETVSLDDYPAFNVPDRRFNALEITRGCIYACAFCQTPFMFKARFRHRSIPNVREHVRLMRRERLRYVRFVTPTSLSYGSAGTEPNLAAVEELLATVREEIGPEGKVFFGTFPSEVRPEHVTTEALALLRRYVDNDNLVIGGQSGSQRVLDATKRDHTVGDVLRAARIAVENGFVPNVDFLFGLPSEDENDHAATVRLMKLLSDIGARVHSHTFMPLPGTPLRDAPPGAVAEPIARELMQLEARGRAYGQWRAQVVSAERLAQRRAK